MYVYTRIPYALGSESCAHLIARREEASVHRVRLPTSDGEATDADMLPGRESGVARICRWPEGAPKVS
eukprot:4301505-Pyramimonas_sp.AAC.1